MVKRGIARAAPSTPARPRPSSRWGQRTWAGAQSPCSRSGRSRRIPPARTTASGRRRRSCAWSAMALRRRGRRQSRDEGRQELLQRHGEHRLGVGQERRQPGGERQGRAGGPVLLHQPLERGVLAPPGPRAAGRSSSGLPSPSSDLLSGTQGTNRAAGLVLRGHGGGANSSRRRAGPGARVDPIQAAGSAAVMMYPGAVVANW